MSDHIGEGGEYVYECDGCGTRIAVDYGGAARYKVSLRCATCDNHFGASIETPSDRADNPHSYGPDPWG